MEAWNAGVFYTMAIMVTIIGVILATRFIYIDRHYLGLIRRQEEVLFEHMGKSSVTGKADEAMIRDHLDDILAIQKAIGYNNSKRDINRKGGLVMDFVSMAAILSLGILASFGVFDGVRPFLLLNVSLAVWFSMSVLNFAMQIRWTFTSRTSFTRVV